MPSSPEASMVVHGNRARSALEGRRLAWPTLVGQLAEAEVLPGVDA